MKRNAFPRLTAALLLAALLLSGCGSAAPRGNKETGAAELSAGDGVNLSRAAGQPDQGAAGGSGDSAGSIFPWKRQKEAAKEPWDETFEFKPGAMHVFFEPSLTLTGRQSDGSLEYVFQINGPLRGGYLETYDAKGRAVDTVELNPDDGDATLLDAYYYDGDTVTSWSDGVADELAYYDNGLLKSRRSYGGSNESLEEYVYDKDGNRVEIHCENADGDYDILAEYDGEGRLLHERSVYSDGGIGNNLSYEYDSSGNLIRLSGTDKSPYDLHYRYEYDADGRPVFCEATDAGKVSRYATREYDRDGNLTAYIEWRPDYDGGPGEMISAFLFEYLDGRLCRVRYGGPYDTVPYDGFRLQDFSDRGLSELRFERDPSGQLSRICTLDSYSGETVILYSLHPSPNAEKETFTDEDGLTATVEGMRTLSFGDLPERLQKRFGEEGLDYLPFMEVELRIANPTGRTLPELGPHDYWSPVYWLHAKAFEIGYSRVAGSSDGVAYLPDGREPLAPGESMRELMYFPCDGGDMGLCFRRLEFTFGGTDCCVFDKDYMNFIGDRG